VIVEASLGHRIHIAGIDIRSLKEQQMMASLRGSLGTETYRPYISLAKF
jgi:hypothetical protein